MLLLGSATFVTKCHAVKFMQTSHRYLSHLNSTLSVFTQGL